MTSKPMPFGIVYVVQMEMAPYGWRGYCYAVKWTMASRTEAGRVL